MKIHIENINSGIPVKSVIDIAPAEEIALRNAVQQALTDLQTIQSAALGTEAAQNAAIKQEAAILEKLIRYIARRVA